MGDVLLTDDLVVWSRTEEAAKIHDKYSDRIPGIVKKTESNRIPRESRLTRSEDSPKRTFQSALNQVQSLVHNYIALMHTYHTASMRNHQYIT